jgi:Domain of unknown function (DUF1906)
MRASAECLRRLTLLLLPLALLGGAGAARAQQPQLRTVRYHGYAVQIPRSWPVYSLARDPRTCVRFDRHALYLGDPNEEQACPATAEGRTEAILISPVHATAAIARLGGSATSFAVARDGVQVTATWSRDRALIASALHRASLPRIPRAPRASPDTALRAMAARVQPRQAGAVYSGLGFDACSAPSLQTMSDWQASPYRALGVYIGGINSACSQPNLTASWATAEVAAGWHLILTYVGLQAPSNECGCSSITPSQATSEGTAAAEDAVTDAQSLGIPAGNPIYDDMEGYSRNSTNSSAVLAFLSAWTSQLHAEGYLSGVYSSSDSGITDLVDQYGTSYVEPDDIWIADWNDEETTSDSSVPSADWANNQRIHQYRGAHNETYGGATINIDSDDLDAATADDTTGVPPPPPPPSLAVSPSTAGTTSLTAKWAGGTGLASWVALAGTNATSLTVVGRTAAHGSATQLAVRSAAPYFAVQALGSSGQVLANSATVATPAFLGVYGHSAFVQEYTGVGGIPAGCYTSKPCHVSTSIASGRTTIATTGTESIPANGTGILHFRLTARGRTLLVRSRDRRLAVTVRTRDTSGASATAPLTLIPFATGGPGPGRSLSQSSLIRIAGVTDFVPTRGQGGILVGCVGAAPCAAKATLSVGRTTIATTKPELVGGGELGYVLFVLTARGRALLDEASGNQLGVRAKLIDGKTTATGSIALVQFS